MRKFLLLLLFSVFALSTAKNANAQGVTTASVNGIVNDDKGPVPGATVTITHLPTGTVYTSVSRADGRFNLPNLRVGGPYSFKVTFIGFKPFTQDDITLNIGADKRIDAKLEDAGKTLTEVTVTGAAGKVINSSRTGASETITRAQIDVLPTVSRSLNDITKLTPSANSTTVGGLSFGGRSNLYNNLTVDGALFNNSFGLSSSLGGQTGAQPISMDAIDQVQVDIAPYDVRQGNFTGAGINTVVKSGTNQVTGTIYDFIRGTGLQGYQAGATTITKTPFSYRQTGVSIGGPIIKNKLFFFVSGEQERNSSPATAYVATGSGASGSQSLVTSADLDLISSTLKTKYGYDPGAYQGYNYTSYSDKITAKFDWNIDKNNVLSAKYFYLKSYSDQPVSNSGISNGGIGYGTTRAPGVNSLPFYGSGYRINNNFNIGIIELDTRFSSKISNRLTAGYSALRDYRASLGGAAIPLVDIGNGKSDALGNVTAAASATETTFGYELFTAGNLLTTNIAQYSDDLTIYAGKHEFTIGTSGQVQSYINGFAPDYNGLYTFNSVSDFVNGLPAAAYTTRNSALSDGSFPYARIKASVFSLYAEDKYHVTDNFRLTYGIRADYDVYPTSLAPNPNAAALTFQQGIQVDPSKLPANRIQISPRIGFNWDVNGDGSTQIRGGSGLFSGLVPFVWISNQASNNGLLFGSYTIVKGTATNTPAQNAQLIFNPNVNANRPTGGAAANTSYELDVADPNLKYPKIWRSNVAIDQRLGGGVIATIEGAYTKDINAIYHQNLVLSDGYTVDAGPEGQIHYNSKNITPNSASPQSVTNPGITGLYYMTNTNQGYSYFVTGQLQKSFSNGIYFNVAYTHSGSQDVNDGGSTASTIWSSRPVAGNPNGNNLSNSSFIQPNRIIATAAWKKEFWKHTTSTISLIFETANAGAVSYITSGDPNNDGATNDLMFIPRTQADIQLVPDFAGDTRTAAQEWAQLNNFINQDTYLNKRRGQYAQRNGVILPYFGRFDLHLAQDFHLNTGNTKHTITVSADIINFGNLINSNWGLYQTTFSGVTNGSVSILSYKGLDGAGRPTYSFPYLDKTNLIPVSRSFIPNNNQLSRYQAQIGLRYTFN